MKQTSICKTQDTVTEEQLAAIGRFTRRPLGGEEVFVFSLILCDNEVDRDFERFPDASLETLGELYIGKTGVFDHIPRAENQSARIFETRMEREDRLNSVGEGYRALKAWAYMVRCDKNADLILEIDAGIKKEVSVGCSVGGILCSVCGADQRTGGCEHQKGETYDGKLCHHLLVDPADAYEWSFVAVPAQKLAGVVKHHGRADTDMDGVLVSKARLDRLERLAEAGGRYEKELRENVVRLGLLGGTGLGGDMLGQITSRLDIAQLEALQKSFGSLARQSYPLSPQLASSPRPEGREEKEFQI